MLSRILIYSLIQDECVGVLSVVAILISGEDIIAINDGTLFDLSITRCACFSHGTVGQEVVVQIIVDIPRMIVAGPAQIIDGAVLVENAKMAKMAVEKDGQDGRGDRYCRT